MYIVFRTYSVSKDEEDEWQNARTLCENLGLGLAMWDTVASYNDLRAITGSSSGMFDKPAWTALLNPNSTKCDSAQNCDGKLVRPQTSK